MKTLAIDTSTLMASVAIAETDAQADPTSPPPVRVLAWRESDVDTHSDKLLPLVDTVLGEAGIALADVDEIAVGAGPGSFTGLRIGMATAKGLAFATDKPLRAISSLAALAMDCACPPPDDESDQTPAPREALLVPVLDARRSEVFAGFYRLRNGAGLDALADERVLAPAALPAAIRDLSAALGTAGPVLLFGDALQPYGDILSASGTLRTDARKTPSAVSVARLTLLASDLPDVLLTGAPVYIRPSEAEI